MKRSPLHYKSVDAGVRLDAPNGLIHVKADRPITLEASVGGIKTILGMGQEIRTATKNVDWIKISPKTAQAVMYAPDPVNTKDTKQEVFTNADRMPMESTSVLAVKQALRTLKIAQHQEIEAMRSEFRNLANKRAAPAVIEADIDDLDEVGLDDEDIDVQPEAYEPPDAAPAKK